jgi:CheY-like chemotaxis protein
MWTDRGNGVVEPPAVSPDRRRWVLAEFLSKYQFPSESTASPTPRESPHTGLVRQDCRILVVDDDLGIRLSLAALLEDEGYIVETATNGEQALSCIALQRPTVVLLDMRMPVMDGWTFARELRQRGIELPLVVMTAARDAEAWADEVAATAYAPKPFDYPSLLATLDRLCER